MMSKISRSCFVCLLAIALFLSACSSQQQSGSHGAIVLGDPATIVTETDPQYLQDNVTDFQSRPVRPSDSAVVKDTAVIPVPVVKADTPKAAALPPAEKVNGKGLNIAFKPFTVFIPGIGTKSFRQQDPANAKGVSYSLENGRLEGNNLQVTGATVTKVMQRYQTVVILKDKDAGNILLQSLGTYSSDWQAVKGSGNDYPIRGISKGQLRYQDISESSVRNAIKKAARSNRLSRKEEDHLLKITRNIRSAAQAPLSIALQSVIWKITAKDASGRSVEKEIRIDVNAE